ncbi:MAG: hypothetical protein JWQ12_1747 [Glaciihabitans sp.]|nr:hypothetical protein [Glaciihabitans sp.]
MLAAAAGTVKHKQYSQTIQQIITDGVKQYGTFCYDGSHARVRTTYRGYQGSHHCVVDYAVGMVVTLRECSESGSTSERTLTQIWNYKPLVDIDPVNWDESYHMTVSSTGVISK